MTNTLINVASIKVSPGIGMGRVGNSNEYFIGPETPGVVPDPGSYKDASGAIKPQAQRFRVFGYDRDGKLIDEITDGSSVNGQVVNIDWQVHVTNMKAANYAFQGKYAFNPNYLRNHTIQPAPMKPKDRHQLIIDPGPKSISGVSKGPVELLDTTGDGSVIFDIPGNGHTLSYRLQYDPPQPPNSTSPVPVTYTAAKVSLGNLHTDDQGRLIFVGGKGISKSCTSPSVVISKVVVSQKVEKNPEYNGNSYFNNPGWYDDTCGGSINAELTDSNGTILFTTEGDASQTGWIAVAPPHYAPTTYNVVSLLDLQLDLHPASDPNTGKGPFYFARAANAQVELATSIDGDAHNLNFSPISAGVDTTVAPAIATFQQLNYIAVTGTDFKVRTGVSRGGGVYSFASVEAAPHTVASPALAVFNDRLYYAINSNGTPYLGSYSSSQYSAFEPLANTASILPEQSPALTSFNGLLYYAIATASGELLIASSKDGFISEFSFTSVTIPIGILSPNNLSLTVYAGKLYCGFVGLDYLPYLGSSSDGSQFDFVNVSNSTRVKRGFGVSLSAFNGKLYYAIASSTSDTQLGYSSDGVNVTFESVAVAGSGAPTIATAIPVNFYRDIYPILRTVTDYAWTNERAFHGHRPGTSGSFLDPEYLETLANPASSRVLISRPFVFGFIRPPAQAVLDVHGLPVTVPAPPAAAPDGINAGHQEQRADLMPRLFGNGGSPAENQTNGSNYPNQWLPLTNHQLEKFQQWVNGNFETGDSTDTQWQGLELPDQLDFAALQPTVGGGFHPGIELTYLMHEPEFFDGPFRFAKDTVPGSIAAYMSVPWQGDFWSCNISWWPSLRPDIVVQRSGDTPPVLSHISWFRSNEIPPESDSIDGYEGGYNVMVDSWPHFGFVTPASGVLDQGQQVYEETERASSLDLPSLLVSINYSNPKKKALSYDGGSFSAKAIDSTSLSQQWRLVASASSAGDLFIAVASNTDAVLTVDFSTGNIRVAPKKIPQDDSQLWQYTPSGYPGHFTLTSKIHLKLLSVQPTGLVNTDAASKTLQQLWLLQPSG